MVGKSESSVREVDDQFVSNPKSLMVLGALEDETRYQCPSDGMPTVMLETVGAVSLELWYSSGVEARCQDPLTAMP